MIPDCPYYAILDTGYVGRNRWIEKFDALVLGGARMLQVRAKRETVEERHELLREAVTANQKFPADVRASIIINDDIDLCLEFEDIGLHVGQDDTAPEEARSRLGPNRVLGLSTHSKEQAGAAMDLGPDVLSYFAVGPVFPTQTKPDYEAVGLDLVRSVAKQEPTLPFYCIGGINRKNVAQVITAGARRVVSVSDVLQDPNTEEAVRQTIKAIGNTPIKNVDL